MIISGLLDVMPRTQKYAAGNDAYDSRAYEEL